MDQHADVDAGRKKAAATEYLQRLLERRGVHPSQQAEDIANLAFDRSNPVNALFSAAAANGEFRTVMAHSLPLYLYIKYIFNDTSF